MQPHELKYYSAYLFIITSITIEEPCLPVAQQMTANQLHQHLRNPQTKRTRVVADELQCVEAEAVDHLAGLRVVVVAKGEMVSHGRDRLNPE